MASALLTLWVMLSTFVARGGAVAALSARALGARAYHQKVIDHYESPRNVGSFEKGATDVGTGLVGAPACGDVMRLQIKVCLHS